MGGTLVLHVLVAVILFLTILACRLYCKKRDKQRSLRFLISRIHPLRVTPVLHPPHNTESSHARRTMSGRMEDGFGECLPGTHCSDNSNSITRSDSNIQEGQEDQVSLESHVIPAESDVRTADYIKSPPPPYSTGDLPSYEEAIRWSRPKSEGDGNPHANNS